MKLFTRINWRISISQIYDDVIANNFFLVDNDLKQIPASEFWRNLIILFCSNDCPKYTSFSNEELVSLFFSLYDPLSDKDVSLAAKWSMVQHSIDPIADPATGTYTVTSRINGILNLILGTRY